MAESWVCLQDAMPMTLTRKTRVAFALDPSGTLGYQDPVRANGLDWYVNTEFETREQAESWANSHTPRKLKSGKEICDVGFYPADVIGEVTIEGVNP